MKKNKKDNLEQEYNDIINNCSKLDEEIKHMEEYKIIKKYSLLKKKRKILSEKEEDLYKKRLLNRYANCRHILVESDTEANFDYEGRTYHYFGCIKCGLDEAVFNRGFGRNREEREMLNIMKKHHIYNISGIKTGIQCDIYKARELYNELVKNNPNLDDEIMAELFKSVYKKKEEEKKVLKKTLNEPRSIWDWPL